MRHIDGLARPIICMIIGCFSVQGCMSEVNSEKTPVWQKEVVMAAAQAIEDGYIYEEKGVQIAEFLQEQSDSYYSIDSKRDFAERVTLDLFSVANDKHLRFFYEPEIGAPTGDDDGSSEMPGHSYCATAPIEFQQYGDVGVITLPRFFGGDDFFTDFDDAMSKARNVSALALDLRNNCGGGPGHVRYVSTYFFAQKTHLVSTEMRDNPTSERWTLDDQPEALFLDKPLYILTNKKTFSAGESFTFGMKATGRALTVGEATGGGGHFGDTVRLTEDFTMFLPMGRTFDPRTGKGWEAEGIFPDIESMDEDAVDAAVMHFTALQSQD